MLNSNEIQKIIPHRYPFLLVDKVVEMDETSIKAIKNISANEMQFMGHFPE
ncbi:MAG TPA: 3-hydroxyacyl-[acyl-carrier-protein] dehydratase FabZ, partial [Erysipelothrix sp.]|nr:3-hydroxyacyl-[acyl-carrier-protein] dehydratase FabZ [Erysipelothrix sp.]